MKVRLTLDNLAMRDGATLRAARVAFGDRFVDKYHHVWHPSGGVDIIATADQLVAFQVARQKLGGRNLWAALKVEILDPQPPMGRVVVDVRPLWSR